MSGHILKISLERTHPPVWRRIVIPQHMTFQDLHDTIQVLFEWTDDHLHAFNLPDHRQITMHMDETDFWRDPEDVYENKAQVDDYIRKYKWIRYVYDFGDNWCHKITYEKEDPAYDQHHPQLLKYKGDNYYEDSGGVFGYGFGEGDYEDNRFPLDEEDVQEKLKRMIIH